MRKSDIFFSNFYYSMCIFNVEISCFSRVKNEVDNFLKKINDVINETITVELNLCLNILLQHRATRMTGLIDSFCINEFFKLFLGF